VLQTSTCGVIQYMLWCYRVIVMVLQIGGEGEGHVHRVHGEPQTTCGVTVVLQWCYSGVTVAAW
jgi:hypothetical protein